MKVECNEGSSGAWTWRVKSGNGQVLANGANVYEGKDAKAKCLKSAESFATATGIEEVVYVEINPAPEPDAAG